MSLNILYNYDLSQLNTFRLTSYAEEYIYLDNEEVLQNTLKYIKQYKKRFFILGGGSNLLLPEFYYGIVLHIGFLGKKYLSSSGQHVFIEAFSGEQWDNFVLFTINNNWYGLENLSFIPGTIGGAPIQNIGAYGEEISSYVEQITAIEVTTQKKIIFQNQDCKFSYRDSIFRKNNQYLIISIVFKLKKKFIINNIYFPNFNINSSIEELRQKIFSARQFKLPNQLYLGSIGSFFTNPIVNNDSELLKISNIPIYQHSKGYKKISAGWLIEKSNLKGYTNKNIGVYYNHALVLINSDRATQNDVLEFAQFIQKIVFTNFKIILHIEGIIIKNDFS